MKPLNWVNYITDVQIKIKTLKHLYSSALAHDPR